MAEGVEVAKAFVTILPVMPGMQKEITKAFGGAASAAQKAGGLAGKAFSGGFGAKMGAVAGIASSVMGKALDVVSDLSGQILEASDSTEKFAQTLNFAGVNADQIKKLTASTQEYANKTVYGIDDIRNTTAQLAANGVPNYDKLAQAAGNLNAVSGGTADTYKSVAMVLTQTAGAGKLTTENWNQLSDAIPGASGKLQEAMKANGAYTGNFRDAMADSQITAEEFNQALLQLGLSDVAKQAAESTSTFEGAFGNLEATIVDGCANIVNTVKPLLTGGITALGNGLQTFFNWVNDAINGTVEYIRTANIGDAFARAFNTDSWSKPFTDRILAIRNLIVGFRDLINGDELSTALQTMFNIDEDSPIVTACLNARNAITDLAGTVASQTQRIRDRIATAMGEGADTIGSLATDAIPLLANAVASAAGALDRLLQVVGPLTGDATALAVALAPILVAQGVQAGIAGYKGLSDGLATLAKTMEGVTSTASGFSNALIIAPELNSVSGALKQYAGNLTLVKNAQAAMGSTAGAFTAVSGAARGLFGVLKGTGAVWGLVAAAVAAVVAGLVLFFTKTETGQQAWSRFSDAMAGAWDAIQAAWGAAMPAIEQFLTGLGSTLGSLVQSALPVLAQLGGAFVQLLQPILANIGPLMGAFQQLGQALMQAFQAIMPSLTLLGSTLVAAFVQIMPMIAQIGAQLAQLGSAILPPLLTLIQAAVVPLVALGYTLMTALMPALAAIMGAIALVVPVVVSLVTAIAQLLLPVIEAMIGAAIAILPVIVEIATTLIGMLLPIITAIVQAVTALIPVITAVVQGLLGVLQPAIEAIVGVIRGVITILQGVITFLTGVFSGNWRQAWEGIKQVFSGVWQTIVAIFKGLWNTLVAALKGGLNIVASLWNGAWNAIGKFFKTIWDGLVNAAKSGVRNVVDTMSGIRDRITGYFSGAGDWLKNAGKAIIDGLLNGLKAAWGGVTSFVSGIGGWIRDHKGPLPYDRRLLVPAGMAIMRGLSRGINNGWARVQRDIAGMNRQLADGFRLDAEAPASRLVGARVLPASGSGYAPMRALDTGGRQAGRVTITQNNTNVTNDANLIRARLWTDLNRAMQGLDLQ